MDVEIVSLAERPGLVEAMWAMPSSWPAFMLQDPVGALCYSRLPDVFPDHQLLAIDDAGDAVGRINSVPFAWAGTDDDLPDRGWEAVLERAFSDRYASVPPTAVSLLEARVVPSRQGTGLSRVLLQAARRNVRGHGLGDLFGPVRPTGKSREPRTPMAEYVARSRDDGLPADPWLRVHVRLGARVVKVCPLSMTVPGTLAEWRAWTRLPLTRSGSVDVPGALTPLHVSVEQDHAVYVEPNVWVHHSVGAVPGPEPG